MSVVLPTNLNSIPVLDNNLIKQANHHKSQEQVLDHDSIAKGLRYMYIDSDRGYICSTIRTRSLLKKVSARILAETLQNMVKQPDHHRMWSLDVNLKHQTHHQLTSQWKKEIMSQLRIKVPLGTQPELILYDKLVASFELVVTTELEPIAMFHDPSRRTTEET